ncbi:alcohol dehydrogenase catalytic domain-containing protein [Escherichia coli]|nr:alcohol dehydrogenase catalytic domain-containing protein [Escherichia coli]MDO2625196.1 alcohol dehydrogenase catalytic domain-containing protein [Escherichia coli]MDO2796369.1 alcohol dehydrogenase catalytic domain-containing protein [Escherichia coli]
MSKVITFNRTGGPEVLEFVDVQVPAPTAGEVQIRVHAIGINRAEIMYRNGQYVIEPEFPARLGYEAAGVVQAVGENVVTNGAIVIHTQRLKSDPGGNLLS